MYFGAAAGFAGRPWVSRGGAGASRGARPSHAVQQSRFTRPSQVNPQKLTVEAERPMFNSQFLRVLAAQPTKTDC